jgi:tetratricopeptide (TPR) repeat protein
MPLDRNAARWLNGFCGIVAIAAVSGLGYLVWAQKQAAESIPISSRTESLRKIKGRAYAAASGKDYSNAERLYLEAIAAYPRDKNLHESLARVYLADGKSKKAWQHLSQLSADASHAIHLPADIRTWFADLEWQYGDRKEGEALCKEITAKDWVQPRRKGQALVARTHVFFIEEAGELPPIESLKHLRRAVALNPTSVDAHVGLANLYWKAKNPPDCFSELDLARRLVKPNDGTGATYLAFMFSHTGKKAEAQKFAEQALSAGVAKNDGIAISLARVFAGLGDRTKALELVIKTQARAKSPDAETLCGFASVYAQLGLKADAIRLLDRADKIAVGGAKAQVFETRREILASKPG